MRDNKKITSFHRLGRARGLGRYVALMASALALVGQGAPTASAAPVSIQLISPYPASPAVRVSDKPDGVDSAFHIVAATGRIPDGARVEAFLTAANITTSIGKMKSVGSARRVWGFKWEIPDTVADGAATIEARVLRNGKILSSDSVPVEMVHKPAGTPPDPNQPHPANTVELTWPSNNGGLGFFKHGTGAWTTVIDGTGSGGTTQPYKLFYSVAPLTSDPVFKDCGSGAATTGPNSTRVFSLVCTLAAGDLPTQITAVAALSQSSNTSGGVVPGSVDAHVVRPYLQNPRDFAVALTSGLAHRAINGCVDYKVTVRDPRGRPAVGVNVDAELVGPGDGAAFEGSSGVKAPDGATTQPASNCAGGTAGQQGFTEVADGPDVKRIESVQGTDATGAWSFRVFSNEVGSTAVKAWVDEPALTNDSVERALDDDARGAGEKLRTASAQWLQAALTLSATPAKRMDPIQTCSAYAVKAAGGETLAKGLNIDVHAQGPLEPRFCKPRGGVMLRPPRGPHGAALHAAGSTGCTGTDPCLHGEGKTSQDGTLVFGVSGSFSGNSSIRVWVDGEPGSDNDIQDTGELNLTRTTKWLAGPGDVAIRLVSPAAFPGAPGTISTARYPVTVRVDAPYLARKVDIHLGQSGVFDRLGTATRIAGTSTFAYDWDLGTKADGAYTLRAQIRGTAQLDDRAITIARAAPVESAALTLPRNGAPAVFSATKATPVTGTATAGTEIVNLFYSKQAPPDALSTWSACGSITLSGTGSAQQTFTGNCTIAAADDPATVTAITAVAYDCVVAGCGGVPPTVTARGANESGRASSVYGCSGPTCILVGSQMSSARIRSCQAATIQVFGEDNQPVAGRRVELLAQGPGARLGTCKPEGAGSAIPLMAIGAGRYRGSANTNANGRVTIGVSSTASGYGSIFNLIEKDFTAIDGWLDLDGNGFIDAGEPAINSVMHWTNPAACTVVGTNGRDELYATSFPDKLCGLGGNDVIYGLDGLTGNDLVLAGAGDDIVIAAKGNDTVFGGPGNDRLLGGDGNDRLYGQAGDDELQGGSGRDRCAGGPGRNRTFSC